LHLIQPSRDLSVPVIWKNGNDGENKGDAIRAITAWSQKLENAKTLASDDLYGTLKWTQGVFDTTNESWQSFVEALETNTDYHSNHLYMVLERKLEDKSLFIDVDPVNSSIVWTPLGIPSLQHPICEPFFSSQDFTEVQLNIEPVFKTSKYFVLSYELPYPELALDREKDQAYPMIAANSAGKGRKGDLLRKISFWTKTENDICSQTMQTRSVEWSQTIFNAKDKSLQEIADLIGKSQVDMRLNSNKSGQKMSILLERKIDDDEITHGSFND